MSIVATERMAIGVAIEAPDARTATAPLSQALGEARRRQLAYAFAKRLLDVVAALTLIVLLLPVFIAVAIAIRLDSPGPIFYRGERIGRFGSAFTVLKFRSMRAGCAATPHVQFVKSLLRDGKTCHLYKVEADPRVTRIGAFLRRTSIDEFPQLWNVLRGEMSLVGPRPDVRYAFEEYSDWMQRRLDVKPGMTGLWQVSGRSRLGLMDMYKLDAWYAQQASLRFDLEILLRTVPVVLGRDGAA
jgi:lipopolysaccharide/colanic/teichoic acid biosynthesis glycosyltransferase